jgi:lipoyl(octanoyl) transferase
VLLPITDLARMPYAEAYAAQIAAHAEVLAAREAGRPEIGRLLLVEHDPPVITISRRPEARNHLLASDALLARHGVTIAETDRGGDITYHGPGQLVVYPIIDLNFLKLGLHDYMRLLEAAVIDTCAGFGIAAERDAEATGVWVPANQPRLTTDEHRAAQTSATDPRSSTSIPGQSSKICAMGVRVRRWVTLHGLALNVTTNLDHFNLIVPCGLVGRPVTSLQRLLGPRCPSMDEVKVALTTALSDHLRRVASARE